MIKSAIEFVFGEFEWYRKRTGGIWYKIEYSSPVITDDEIVTAWVRDPKGSRVIEKIEY